ncbi:hypothetical protein BO83DRAFT_16809 [Aspergillus eucalypticola CBS 122712]|uniref:Protein efr3 n=1 Tax=Aspergillus eucalypticola (strain CBS 122712 / IBT 29274) TaxID=1448314 RepID=A0A317VKL7_ASPEC|nr:uncharacterized protein BO83DRAFT_16809 [Aspergillus eucalypticola CBS 122712]PWY74826.1 hypothetical protein BO83DRAFT_16809 [Aspergillus eucalypticola CBS 122712]
MEGVRQSCRPKHQVLVLKCFPQYQKGIPEVKPNPSELSYLLYYASTRRSKLTKVGAFLEKRAARDVWRRKIGNVQVTLQILTALIEKVPRDLPIYARSVLTVIETVLRSRDITIVEDSIATFEMFCRHQDMAALSAEQDFATQYREVVRTYASFAEVHSPQLDPASSGPAAIRWRSAGLRAIKGVVSSEAGLAADGGDSLRIILPVILENVCHGDEDVIPSLEQQLMESEKSSEADLAHRRRISNATVQTVDTATGDPALASQSAADADKKAEMDVRLLALSCLERIVVTGSSRGQIRVTTKVVLDFMLRRNRTTSLGLSLNSRDSWATSLIELVAKWCPVQVRFIILVAAMELLFDVNPREEALDEPFIIVYMIDWLLKSPVNMIGLSVIDILLGLLQHMSFLLSPAGSEKQVELFGKRADLITLFQRCIGDLTTHIYYGDQVVDMIRVVLTRIKPSSTHEHPAQVSNDSPGAASQAGSLTGEASSIAFSSTTGRVAALRAIKNILIVANSRNPAAVSGVESRNHVGIHVWEGTQWLLQERQGDARYAYADALLSWLKLETNQSDLTVKDKHAKPSVSKGELTDVGERTGKRSVSTAMQREKAAIAAQFNFLRMLHLTIYDIALESPTSISEIRLLHLILASLVDKLGVNAARFGLPMVLKLQDDMNSAPSLASGSAKVNIGSLVYGYLWALSERFELRSTEVGQAIQGEISKRQQLGLWLDPIRLPAADLEQILQGEVHRATGNTTNTDQMTPFITDVEHLVRGIEDAYNHAALVSSHSPPGSPTRSFTMPILGHGSVSAPRGDLLPPLVREQMLSAWSRESCLAAAERERTEALSLNGSKAGTMAIRSHIYLNGADGSSPSTTSPPSAQQSAAGLHNSRRMSVPESARGHVQSTSRESPVHINDLRRVLSINDQDKMRRLSPLRGRLDTSNRSVVSSSSESMVSGYSLSEIDGDGASIRPQSTRDGHGLPDGDGMVTPKASALGYTENGQAYFMAADDIPPVPPIPPSLSVTGGMSNDSQRSLASERPSTAPGPRRLPTANGKPGTPAAPHHSKSLNKHKSRSSTGLAAAAADGDYSRGHVYDGVPDLSEPTDSAQRRDVQNLLNGFLSPAHAESQSRPGRPRGASRRGITGGIGRPPY